MKIKIKKMKLKFKKINIYSSTKNMKYLGITLLQIVQSLYTENCKTLLKVFTKT